MPCQHFVIREARAPAFARTIEGSEMKKALLLLTACIIVGMGATQLLHAAQEPAAVTGLRFNFAAIG